MVLKNDRVMAILDFIDAFKVCDVTHIARMFYPKHKYAVRDAQKKLTALVEDKALSRKRSDMNSKYYYWIRGEKEFDNPSHRLLVVELYVKLCEKYGTQNVSIDIEYQEIESIRPDALIRIRREGKTYLKFIEVHISNNDLNLEKHLYASKLNHFGNNVFPDIVVITNRKVTVSTEVNKRLNVLVMDLKMSKFNLI